jgi:hypothetical protein
MNIYFERQPRAPGAMNCLVTMLERPDRLTVRIVAVPMEGRDGRTSPSDGVKVPPTRGREDDLANATWEDAAWQ